MFKILFTIVALSLLIMALVKHERITVFKLALFSSLVYFLPGFFGYVQLPYFLGTEEIDAKVYIIYLLTLLTLYTFSTIFGKQKGKSIKFGDYNGKDHLITQLLVISTLFVFLAMLITMGSTLFSESKSDIAENHNRWRMLFQYITAIGLVYSFTIKKKSVFLLFLVLSFFNLYTGNRSHTALAFIGIIYLQLLSLNKVKIIKYKKLLLSVISIGSLFFIYKGISGALRAGLYDVVMNRLSDLNYYGSVVNRSEPFIVQNILNQVVENDYQIGLTVYKPVLSILIPLYSEVFGNVDTFSSLYARDFYSNVNYGMGSNIFAEAYSAGGLGFVFIFIVFYSFVLLFYEKIVFFIQDNFLRSGLALSIAYMVFYIHRNNLVYQLLIQKRIILITLSIYLIAHIIFYMSKRHKKKI
ncbi:O-antigen polysaccharide polymerase Wzy [Cytobacillus firmus]|uniref:O-antigen polysaccharide polymerase Wzy n=1 Tax=Cytobacillus firmus TaxID=1399 RepID=UPI00216174BA|nr:O-antigen polysaccharide polymerase Wzy [Cytobacillus firmus]MCS0654820.1 O-antigen polysaccharide polymerase Wzy [Cytobacillus firmus]